MTVDQNTVQKEAENPSIIRKNTKVELKGL
jgi:hypothetical protein